METLETMRASREYSDNLARDAKVDMWIDHIARGYVYLRNEDGAYHIEDLGGGRFSAMVGNHECVGTLKECEAYLWENWVSIQENS